MENIETNKTTGSASLSETPTPQDPTSASSHTPPASSSLNPSSISPAASSASSFPAGCSTPANPSMESTVSETLKTVAPILASIGNEIAGKFYHRLLSTNPQLRHIFNQANQLTEKQPRALAKTVFEFARLGGDVAGMMESLELIANKHCGCLIQPSHYPLVSNALLDTLKNDFAIEGRVLDNIGKGIGGLANFLINRERELYEVASVKESGGWSGLREFRVGDKVKETEEVISFQLIPVDGERVFVPLPGQFISIHLPPNPQIGEFTQIRHYSVSDLCNGTSYRISVKRHPKGKVSCFLHDHVFIGTRLYLTPPYGSFRFPPSVEKDHFGNMKQMHFIFLSSGVGSTALFPMFKRAAEWDCQVTWGQTVASLSNVLYERQVEAVAATAKAIVAWKLWCRSSEKTNRGHRAGREEDRDDPAPQEANQGDGKQEETQIAPSRTDGNKTNTKAAERTAGVQDSGEKPTMAPQGEMDGMTNKKMMAEEEKVDPPKKAINNENAIPKEINPNKIDDVRNSNPMDDNSSTPNDKAIGAVCSDVGNQLIDGKEITSKQFLSNQISRRAVVYEGDLDVAQLFVEPPATSPSDLLHVFLCGGDDFVAEIRRSLLGAGVAVTSIHHEVFGPQLGVA